VALSAVYDLAQRITAKYGIDGYVLSRAIVPPQNLSKGGAVIRIEVIEGYVDKVVWPAGLERYRDFFSYYAAKIIADRPTNVRTMERYLLLAGELPGLKFSTSLKASEKNPNAATLNVEVVYKPVEGVALLNNRGTPARGPLQYLGSLTANNLLGAHDAFTFTMRAWCRPTSSPTSPGATGKSSRPKASPPSSMQATATASPARRSWSCSNSRPRPSMATPA
jgi:hemolysin activation/secretion protein